jgi:hypothetical protein
VVTTIPSDTACCHSIIAQHTPKTVPRNKFVKSRAFAGRIAKALEILSAFRHYHALMPARTAHGENPAPCRHVENWQPIPDCQLLNTEN